MKPGRFLTAIRVFGLAPWRATLARGSLVTGFSDRVAFLLALPAFDPTLGAFAPTVATGAGAVAVLFCKGLGFRAADRFGSWAVRRHAGSIGIGIVALRCGHKLAEFQVSAAREIR